jgi:hypothetical protein
VGGRQSRSGRLSELSKSLPEMNSGHPACGLVTTLVSPQTSGLGMISRSSMFFIKQEHEMWRSNGRTISSNSQKGAMPKKFSIALFRWFIAVLSFVFRVDADRSCLHIHFPNFRTPPNLFASLPSLVPSHYGISRTRKVKFLAGVSEQAVACSTEYVPWWSVWYDRYSRWVDEILSQGLNGPRRQSRWTLITTKRTPWWRVQLTSFITHFRQIHCHINETPGELHFNIINSGWLWTLYFNGEYKRSLQSFT